MHRRQPHATLHAPPTPHFVRLCGDGGALRALGSAGVARLFPAESPTRRTEGRGSRFGCLISHRGARVTLRSALRAIIRVPAGATPPRICFLGDWYPVCNELPLKHFFRVGARYRYTGSTSSYEPACEATSECVRLTPDPRPRRVRVGLRHTRGDPGKPIPRSAVTATFGPHKRHRWHGLGPYRDVRVAQLRRPLTRAGQWAACAVATRKRAVLYNI